MQSFKKNIKKLLLNKVSIITFLSLVAGMLSLLFTTFNPHDQSWMCFSSKQQVVTNIFGPFGADVAAFFFYLFGSSCWLIVAFILVIIHDLFYNKLLQEKVIKIVAFLLLFISSCVLAYLYNVEFFVDINSGGYLGYISFSKTAFLLDDLGAKIFFHNTFFVSLVLLFPFVFVQILHGLTSGALFVSDKQKFLYPAKDLGTKIVYYSSVPFVYTAQFVYKLFSGQDFFDSKQTIVEFENQLSTAKKMEQDKFWKSYVDALKVKSNASKKDNSFTEKNVTTVNSDTADKSLKGSFGHLQEEQDTTVQNDFQNNDTIEKKATYKLPPENLFTIVPSSYAQENMDELQSRAKILEEKLKRFGVQGKVTSIKCGPVVTLFEYEPHIDSKISKIVSLEDDLALALQAMSIRIIAPIPGTAFVGFEVANFTRKNVLFSSLIQSDSFKEFSGQLPLILGENIVGKTVIIDLAKMPHLLIAGSTGSGKSVALNTFLVSLLCKLTPDELKLILIDPKRLEFTTYSDIAHLLFPIVTDPRRAAPILKWVVQQMEERYDKMATVGVRNIADYNNTVSSDQKLPSIVVVIDELSDLMMTTGKDVEDLIARIAQMARAAGIHMIIATQRPSVDVITGLIKVNFPSRISFRVTSKVDSRTILDRGGAEKLLGNGDMLFLNSSGSMLQRLHGAYVSDQEIEDVVSHIKQERVVQYLDIHTELMHSSNKDDEKEDVLYQDVLEFLDTISEVSISLLQRKFRIGYNRSARIIDKLESQGLVMPADGGKKRKVVR